MELIDKHGRNTYEHLKDLRINCGTRKINKMNGYLQTNGHNAKNIDII